MYILSCLACQLPLKPEMGLDKTARIINNHDESITMITNSFGMGVKAAALVQGAGMSLLEPLNDFREAGWQYARGCGNRCAPEQEEEGAAGGSASGAAEPMPSPVKDQVTKMLGTVMVAKTEPPPKHRYSGKRKGEDKAAIAPVCPAKKKACCEPPSPSKPGKSEEGGVKPLQALAATTTLKIGAAS